MTKFEEKLEILPIKIIQHPDGDTKYYAAVHVKTLIAQADEEIADLKSQLQQQALPVVPECVAEWYEEHKDDLDYSIYSLCEEFDDTEPNREPTEFESWFDIVSNQPILTLVGMRNGYTVEKPQLFYLKNKLTGAYLYYDEATKLYSDIVGNVEDFFGTKTKFTQTEIDSMETGSYEQIEVAE